MSNLALQMVKEFIKTKLLLCLTVSVDKNIEPKIVGYRSKNLSEKNWQSTSDKKSATIVYDWATWEFGEGKVDIYGYFVKNNKSHVLWRELFDDGPYRVFEKEINFV